jgi:hypothetical protein
VGTCCTIRKHFHKFPKRCHRRVLLEFVYFIHTRKQGEGGGEKSVTKSPKRIVCRSIGGEVGMYVRVSTTNFHNYLD